MFLIADGRQHFYQWDINQKLIVEDASIKQVHFCNKTDDCSLVVEVRQEDGKRVVYVPNILLQTAWDIRAYAYTGEATKLEARYKVLARTKPTDYVYTETEVLKWEQLAKELTDEVKQLEEDIIATVEDIVADSSASADNANALLGSKQGEVITINDASPIKKDIAVKVKGKNLMPYPYVTAPRKLNGVDITINEDKSITFNGTCTGTIWFILSKELPTAYSNLGSLTFSGCPSGGSRDTYFVSHPWTGNADIGSGISFTTINENFGEFTIIIKEGTVCNNLIFKPQLEQGTTKTAYTPYIEDLSTVEVKACGKNLLKSTNYTIGSLNSTTGDVNTSGDITKYVVTSDYIELKAGTYTFSNNGGANLRYVAEYNKDDKSFVKAKFSSRANPYVYTVANDCFLRVDVERANNVDIDNFDIFFDDFKIMLEQGRTATAYEPYKEPITYKADADGNANVEPIYPITTLIPTLGAVMQADYNRDINKAYQELYNAIISLGGNI